MVSTTSTYSSSTTSSVTGGSSSAPSSGSASAPSGGSSSSTVVSSSSTSSGRTSTSASGNPGESYTSTSGTSATSGILLNSSFLPNVLNSPQGKLLFSIGGALLGAILLCIISLCILFYLRKKDKRSSVIYTDLSPKLIYGVVILDKIGDGNFGEVYKGLWQGVEVALKKMNTPDQTEAFFEEALLLQKLSHPNIVQVKTETLVFSTN